MPKRLGSVINQAAFIIGLNIASPAQAQLLGDPPDLTGETAAVPAFTPTFRVDPNVFLSSQVTSNPFQPVPQLGIQAGIREFFMKSAVDLSAMEGASLFYNDRTGFLFVRAADSHMKLIEAALRNSAHQPPPVVLVEIHLAEIPEGAPSETLNEILNLPEGASLHVRTRLAEAGYIRSDNQLVAALTESKTAELLQTLKQMAGVEILVPPAAKTISGRQARILLASDEPVLIPPFHAPGKPPKAGYYLKQE